MQSLFSIRRWLPKFSLRTIVLCASLSANGFGLWWRWEPWELSIIPNDYKNRKESDSSNRSYTLEYGVIPVDINTGDEILPYLSLQHKVCAIGYSLDRERIYSVSQNGKAKIWDAETRKCLTVLVPPMQKHINKRVYDVRYAECQPGRILIECLDGNSHLWLLRRPECWWGIAWLWEFWAMTIFGVALAWSLKRDWKRFGTMKKKFVVEPNAEGM